MTGKERIMRIFQGKETDRPALKLWGARIGQKLIHPAYKPVYELATEMTDIMDGASSKFNIYFGAGEDVKISYENKPLPDSHWADRVTYIRLPDRRLRSYLAP